MLSKSIELHPCKRIKPFVKLSCSIEIVSSTDIEESTFVFNDLPSSTDEASLRFNPSKVGPSTQFPTPAQVSRRDLAGAMILGKSVITCLPCLFGEDCFYKHSLTPPIQSATPYMYLPNPLFVYTPDPYLS